MPLPYLCSAITHAPSSVRMFGVFGLNAVSFVPQSKGGESPLRVSFKPSGSGIGLKPLAPFYQALCSWQEFVAGIL